jgi:hypothetical protein
MGNQHAPRGITILVAAVLVIIGVLGTFLGVIPSIGGVPGTTTGAIAYVAATVVMLAGVYIRGL